MEPMSGLPLQSVRFTLTSLLGHLRSLSQALQACLTAPDTPNGVSVAAAHSGSSPLKERFTPTAHGRLRFAPL